MKLKSHLVLFVAISVIHASCGGGSRAGAKVAQKLVTNFSKNARNSARFFQSMRRPGVVTTKNGRLVAYGRAAELGKIRIPNPRNLSTIRNAGVVEGSPVARNAVKNTEIDLLLYDSRGNAIVYASQLDNALMYRAASRSYQKKVVDIADDIFGAVRNSKIGNEVELKKIIETAVRKRMEDSVSRPYVFDATSGSLTFNVEFFNGSQIVGKLNIYDTVKNGLIVGAGGYYLAKRR